MVGENVTQMLLANARLGFAGPSLPDYLWTIFGKIFRYDSQSVVYYSTTGRNMGNRKTNNW